MHSIRYTVLPWLLGTFLVFCGCESNGADEEVSTTVRSHEEASTTAGPDDEVSPAVSPNVVVSTTVSAPKAGTGGQGSAEYPGDQLLAMVHECVERLAADSTGVGGGKLRFETLRLTPHSPGKGQLYELPEPRSTLWHIRIEEEGPRSALGGVEFVLNVATGRCGHAPME